MTRGCTKQACSYRDHHSNPASVNAIVVGISGDGIENSIHALADSEETVIKVKFMLITGEYCLKSLNTGTFAPIIKTGYYDLEKSEETDYTTNYLKIHNFSVFHFQE